LSVQQAAAPVSLQSHDAPIVEVKSISKAFGHVQALSNVDLAIYPNEVLAIVGDNGAGKSTLVKILSGAYRPDSGEMQVDGRRVEFCNVRDSQALGIATLYQDLALVGCRDVADNLYLGREPVHGLLVDKRKMVAEATETIKNLNVGLPSVRTKVSFLSGGQRQAVAIGRAIHHGGRVLLLDEPTAALGVRESHQILSLLEQLATQGRAIVIISHNLSHIFRVADRIFVLQRGRAVGWRHKIETDSDEIVKMITGADLL
jgi:ABC-type sugar transport system ATPase subunit